ncbi:MAG: response regulator [Deltaproteobacteria bacterium]|nr:response regulator [Deltaproteobacteria bacterium]MBW1815823.1 response regulator [Deltaproteobacteria bacterium]MBW2283265.1 response regulator [Deltaproteobacteria bacterium]
MGAKPNILIAEPEKTLAADLAAFADERGFNLIGARTRNETLLTLQERRIDVLVLDAELLDQDCAFISIVKGMEEDLPIILCAETNTPEFESKVRRQRIFFYHIKSFGPVDLKTAISNAIEKSSQH